MYIYLIISFSNLETFLIDVTSSKNDFWIKKKNKKKETREKLLYKNGFCILLKDLGKNIFYN